MGEMTGAEMILLNQVAQKRKSNTVKQFCIEILALPLTYL